MKGQGISNVASDKPPISIKVHPSLGKIGISVSGKGGADQGGPRYRNLSRHPPVVYVQTTVTIEHGPIAVTLVYDMGEAGGQFSRGRAFGRNHLIGNPYPLDHPIKYKGVIAQRIGDRSVDGDSSAWEGDHSNVFLQRVGEWNRDAYPGGSQLLIYSEAGSPDSPGLV